MNDSDGIGAYGEAWLETGPSRRLALLERAWAPEATYCDPLAFVQGRQALSEHIGQTQAGLAGGRVEVTAEAVRHHDSAYFPWAITGTDGARLLTGFDVVQLDVEGRITPADRLLRRLTGPAPQGRAVAR